MYGVFRKAHYSARPLLFLIYVNHLKDATKSLDSIMFADDTNFFYSHKNVKDLFYTVNSELEKISQWFKANKLSINIKKTKFTLFHKNSFKDEIQLKLPALMIGNNNTKRKSLIEFLGVMLNEHIFWIDPVRTVENKIAKYIGLIYRVSQFLNKDSRKTIYFSYIQVCNEIEKSLVRICLTCSTHCI